MEPNPLLEYEFQQMKIKSKSKFEDKYKPTMPMVNEENGRVRAENSRIDS